jgi:hypothetical protein
MESNPWKTPFGILLIGVVLIAVVAGVLVASGVLTFTRTTTQLDVNVSQNVVDLDSVALPTPIAEEREPQETATAPEGGASDEQLNRDVADIDAAMARGDHSVTLRDGKTPRDGNGSASRETDISNQE